MASDSCLYCLPIILLTPSTEHSVRQIVYIESGRESDQKEPRERVIVRLNDVSFLQLHRGDFIERLLQSIDRPSGMDTVKPRMERESVYVCVFVRERKVEGFMQ